MLSLFPGFGRFNDSRILIKTHEQNNKMTAVKSTRRNLSTDWLTYWELELKMFLRRIVWISKTEDAPRTNKDSTPVAEKSGEQGH